MIIRPTLPETPNYTTPRGTIHVDVRRYLPIVAELFQVMPKKAQ